MSAPLRILEFGETGQVARELAPYESVACPSRAQTDLTGPSVCKAAITATDAKAVINTAVDKAEEERITGQIINAMAATAMAAAARDLPFVHISTNYVFAGTGTAPRTSTQSKGTLGAYGASKLGGKMGGAGAGAGAGGRGAILRTSWVFSAHGNNLVKTMRRLGAERYVLSNIGGQIGGPTAARDIAAACMTIASTLREEPSSEGTYHFSGTPDISWADFAREIFA